MAAKRTKNGRFVKKATRKRTARKKTTTRKRTARKAPARRKASTRKRTARRKAPARKRSTRRRRKSPEGAITATAKKAAAVGVGLALAAMAVKVSPMGKAQEDVNGRIATSGIVSIAMLFMAKELGRMLPFLKKQHVEWASIGVMTDAALRFGAKSRGSTQTRLGTVAGTAGNARPTARRIQTAGTSAAAVIRRVNAAA